MNLRDDNTIVTSFKHGSDESFSHLFSRFYQSICFYISKYGIEDVEAEEIAQDSFLKLWDRRADFDNLQSILSFLYITSKNATLNLIDKKKRLVTRQENFLKEDESFIEMPISNQIIYTETLSILKQAISQLPDQCQSIINMLYVEGLSTQEISEKLGITASTIYNQKARGIELLKQKLNTNELFILTLLICLLHN